MDTTAFAGDSRPPSSLAAPPDEGIWSAVPVQRSTDDAETRFFSRNEPRAAPPGPPPPPPAAPDDLDSLDADLDSLSPAYDDYDDLGRGPTPALLAAKAEPLGEPKSVARRPNRRPAKPGRPSSASQAARARARSRTERNRRKPKEPSKAVLALGVVAIVAAGFGAAYFLTRGGSSDAPPAEETAEPGTGDLTTDEPATDDTATSVPAETGPAAGLQPVVVFDEAVFGPIQAGVEYAVSVRDGPSGATYQLLVDGEPQAEPAAELPPTMFAPGRHLLEIQATSPEGNVSTPPVVVYAIGEGPAAGWWANLASVNIDENVEGWAEAMRRYDELVAAGHTQLELVPSASYPSLPPGYWILYVGGFTDSESAAAYCTANGLLTADECWAREFDPGAPAGG
jgi:hypothetical protein